MINLGHVTMHRLVSVTLCVLFALAFILIAEVNAQDLRPKILTCGGSFDVTSASGAKVYSSPLLTFNFGRSFAFYQEGDNVLAKLRSTADGTFAQEPEIAVATGQLLGAVQNIDVGVAIYRDPVTQDVVARSVNSITRVVSNRFAVMKQSECDSATIGTAFSSNAGIIVWGSNLQARNSTLMREAPNFSTLPGFDRLLINQTQGGFIETGAMDSSGTILFIFNHGTGRACGFLATGTSSSFVVRNRVTEIGNVPLPLDVQNPVLSSNRQNEYILMGNLVRGDQGVIKAMHTFNVGGVWTELLEVLVLPNNPLSQQPFGVTWTDRWVVAYDSAEVGYQILQMEKGYPFLFDWREAQRNAFKANISTSVPAARSVVLLPRFSTMLMLTSANTPEGGSKIVAIGCSLQLANGGVVVQDNPRFILVVCAFLSLLALTW